MLNQSFINKIQNIAKESKELQIKEFNFTPSLDSLSLDVWRLITPMERYSIMQMVKSSKQAHTYQDRCCKLIKEYIKEIY